MTNPYEVSPIHEEPYAVPVKTDGAPWQMQYMESLHYIFRNPNWATNVLMGFLCLLSTQVIPIIGQLVFVGYIYEIVDSLHRTNGQRYPDFDFNRFGDYLMRSLGPVLVTLVTGLALFPVLAAVFGIAFLFPILAGAIEAGEAVVAAAFIFAVLLGIGGLIAAILAYNCLVTPLCLRGGLTANVGEAFQFSWGWEFTKKTWMEISLMMLFLIAASVIAEIVGLAAFCIGIFAAIAIVMMMSAHLTFQIYRVYLSRGGDPIPLKVPPPPMHP